MNKRSHPPQRLSLALAALIAAASCGGGSQASNPTPVPTPVATPTPEPPPEPTPVPTPRPSPTAAVTDFFVQVLASSRRATVEDARDRLVEHIGRAGTEGHVGAAADGPHRGVVCLHAPVVEDPRPERRSRPAGGTVEREDATDGMAQHHRVAGGTG